MNADRSSVDGAVALLDRLLRGGGGQQVSDRQMWLVLDSLAGATDPAVVGRFPAVLALCARHGIALDAQALFGRHWASSPRRQNLEKLLLASAELFERLKLPAPGNLDRIARGLRRKYPGLTAAGVLELSTGVTLNLESLARGLGRGGQPAPAAAPTPGGAVPKLTAELRKHLGWLFTPKQVELVYKKLDGRPMTKTEREYYSRSVRKKLAAISDRGVQQIAGLLGGRARR